MKWPWRKEKEYSQQPEEYMSPEELEEYLQGLDREAKAWRSARGSTRSIYDSGEVFREPSTRDSYVSSEYESSSPRFSGNWKDFLVKYYYADSDANRWEILRKELNRMKNAGHKRDYSIAMLQRVLNKQGMSFPEVN